MDQDQIDAAADAAAAAADAPTADAPPLPGVHPIARLEEFFRSHLKNTRELAGHVGTVAGQASAAAQKATEVAGDVERMAASFGKFASDVSERFTRLEAQVHALAPPALGEETTAAAAEVEQAVAEAGAAVEAQPPAEGSEKG